MFDCFVCGNPFESEAELSKHHSEVHDLDDGYKPPGGEVTDQKNPTSNQSVPNTAVMKPSHQEFMLSNGPMTSMISNAENPPMLPNVPLPPSMIANVPSKPPPKIRFSALKTTVSKQQKRLKDTKTPSSEYAIKNAKVCPICKAGFIHDNDLVDHLMKGHGDFSKPKQKQIFKCKECDFQASVEELLKNHENNFHPKLSTLPPNPVLPTADQDKFTCNVCEEKFDMEIKFFLHFKDKHTSKKVEDESSKVAAKQSIETPGAKSKGDLAAKLAKLAPQVTPMVVASMTPLQAPFVPIAPRNVPRNVPLQFPMTRLRSPMVPPSISLTPAVQGLISPHQLQNASFHFPMERLQRPLIRPKPRSPPIQAPIPILPPSISLIPASRLPVQEPTQPQSFPFIQSSASLAPIPVTASLDHVQVPAQAKLAPIQSLLEPVSTPVDQEPDIIDPEPEIIDPEPEIIDPEPEIDPVQATFDAKVPEEKIVIKEEPLDKSFTVPMLPVPINAIKPEPMDLGETNVEETEDIEFENEEIPMFNCDACSKSFIDQETLEMHKEEAHFDDDSEDEYSLENDDEFFGQDDLPANLGSGQVPCQFCPEKFNEKVELDHHILVEHLKTNFDCKICAQKCYSFRDLGLHVQNNHPKHNCDFECHICKKQFASTLNLQVHLLGMHLKVHSCEDCDQKFICKVDLVKHQDLEHPLEFKCDTCDIFFKTELALSEHKLLIHPQKAFFRCKCKKTFDEARHLTTHLVYEHAGDSNKCDFCWESYGSQRKLFLHISKIHEPNFTMTTEENMEDDQEDPDTTEEEITEPIQPGDDKCPQCSKVMPKADINNHLLTVHFDFKLRCCHCQKEFKNLMALGNYFINFLLFGTILKYFSLFCRCT